MKPDDIKEIKISWYQSVVTKVAILIVTTSITTYLFNLYINIYSLQSLTSLIHDQEIEDTLDQYLVEIKKNYKYKQDHIKLEIAKKISENKKISLAKVTEIAQRISINAFDSQEKVKIEKTPQIKSKLEWLNKKTLAGLGFTFTFPDYRQQSEFDKVNQIKQKYQILGEGFVDKIEETLYYQQLFTVLFSFFLFFIIFFMIARFFHKYLKIIMTGFAEWASGDMKFRFSTKLPGEFGVILDQFNYLADNVQSNQERSLYLEKIGSWQIIARKMAHEIKNPLTPIQMMTDQIFHNYKGKDQNYKALLKKSQKIIHEEIHSLKTMVNHFSQFAELPEAKLKDHDLVPLMKDIIFLHEKSFPQHVFIYSNSEEFFYVPIDKHLISQVLTNLVKNACESSSEALQIKLYFQEESENFNIYIEDNGPGIPKEIYSNVFEAYVTTKRAKPDPGLGLGLAVSRKIIMDHRGEILVYSRPGKTIFTIRLPKKGPRNEQRS